MGPQRLNCGPILACGTVEPWHHGWESMSGSTRRNCPCTGTHLLFAAGSRHGHGRTEIWIGETEITAQEDWRNKNRPQLACAMESRTGKSSIGRENMAGGTILQRAHRGNVPGNRASPKSKAARHSLSRQPYRSSTPCVLPAGRSEKKDARQRPKCDSETSDPEPSVPSYTENTEMEQRQEGIGTRLVTSRLP